VSNVTNCTKFSYLSPQISRPIFPNCNPG